MTTKTVDAAAKLTALLKTRASIFNTIFNPTNARTGNKILRSRLRGPSMLTYYPQQDQNSKAFKLRAFTDQFPELDLIDVKNAVRVDEIERRKRRGKGAPKKGEGKRSTLKGKK